MCMEGHTIPPRVSLVSVRTSGSERTFSLRTTAYLSVSICTFLLVLPALRTLISRVSQ